MSPKAVIEKAKEPVAETAASCKKKSYIIVRTEDNRSSLHADIKKMAENPVDAALTGGNICFTLKSEDDHRLVTRMLEEKKIPYHIYELSSGKSSRIVIRVVARSTLRPR